MIKKIKKVLKHQLTSDQLIAKLKQKGMMIGERVAITNPENVHFDTQYPYCIEIGNDVTITADVTILAHDFSYSVLNQVYQVMPQNTKNTVIGNNVFIGQSAIILMGSQISDNVVIGAGSVVHGTIPPNTVWAGNPAKMICTLEEFKNKRLQNYESGAICLAKQIAKYKKRMPTEKEMRMYIGLFCPRIQENRHLFDELNTRFDLVGDNVWNMEPKYANLEEFLKKNNI